MRIAPPIAVFEHRKNLSCEGNTDFAAAASMAKSLRTTTQQQQLPQHSRLTMPAEQLKLKSEPFLDCLSEYHNQLETANDFNAIVKYENYSSDECEAEAFGSEQLASKLSNVARFLEIVQEWPMPQLSLTAACFAMLLMVFASPKSCAQCLIFPVFRLCFGTLYPAYYSYKAVRSKDVKQYVKWMMYWIVYAFFTSIETITDVFLAWFPFYYELKVIMLLWLLSPATKGSSTIYRKFIHPMLLSREEHIDNCLATAKDRGYSLALQLATSALNYATNAVLQTALKFYSTKSEPKSQELQTYVK